MRKKRNPNDFYETPKKLTQVLLNNCPFIEGNILEPCCGSGAISNYLREQGFGVQSNDISQGQEYDATSPQYWKTIAQPVQWTITNPPFTEAAKILKHALNFSSLGVAMLLRLTFLEPCKNRANLLKNYADNLVTIIPINPRPRFRNDTNQTDSTTVAWLVWQHSHSWKALHAISPFIFEDSWHDYN